MADLTYRRLAWPLLRRIDPERAHEATIAFLAFAQRTPPGRALLRAWAGSGTRRPLHLMGLEWPNPLGVAAGLDKEVRVAEALALLGFGHVEVGTLTPRPQAGNPRPRVFRLPADRAIVNRMGFPNPGVEAVLPRLERLARRRTRFVLGISIGKQKETPLERAGDDYVELIERVGPWADYLAVNVSSPNTPGLRELQGPTWLGDLLGRLVAENRRLAAARDASAPPLLVKIAPDLDDGELDDLVDAARRAGVDGLIATNTTISREGLTDPARTEGGGLSGRPLAERSTEVVAALAARSGPELPIVGVGGIDSPAAAREKLAAGASLLQLYTGMVYKGPGLAGRIVRGL